MSVHLFNDDYGLRIGKDQLAKIGFHGVPPVPQDIGSSFAAIGTQAGNLTVASLKTLFIAGRNGIGAMTAAGIAIGDTIKLVADITDGTSIAASFEATATVADQIQQTGATDYSAKKLLVIAAANSTADAGTLKTLANALRTTTLNHGLHAGT